jgi:PAS domain S-box-containing protein
MTSVVESAFRGTCWMSSAPLFAIGAHSAPIEVLRQDGTFVLCRTWREGADGIRQCVLTLLPAADQPSPSVINRLAHEYELKDYLDESWAARPLELVHERGRTFLVLDSPDAVTLDRVIGTPLEIGLFMRLAIAVSIALGQLHQRALVHKDIKPGNLLVNSVTGQIWLTGFGIASPLPRERQSPEPPVYLAGTLAYMAPEQTGRMNRSIDSRSDLYSLGVTLYEMLTGSLPFIAADPMEWVHCHVARRPVPPHERVKDVPVPLSAIIMKLLAKTPEERYQTAHGVERDLRRCLTEWDTRGSISQFPLGEQDIPDRLLIPEKLYGRASEVENLLTSFERVVASGRPELVLVSGYAGIGKSSVVNELHKLLVRPGGLFASGKFDQYKRDIPYATLAQAFHSLIHPLLSHSERELCKWRDAFRNALGLNGQLIVDLVPDLQLIIGEQPRVPELPPHDAQRRFQLVFRRFIGVFATPEHPLALFLDDLQWADAATLDVLEDLLTQRDVRNLLLIGAYRDNGADSAGARLCKLQAIRQAGVMVQDIVLAPLTREDVGQLLADTLHCKRERATPLAQLIHEKTAGNPFFTIQLISSLLEKGLLTFHYGAGQWSWDLHTIRAKGYTDNVVDLMVGKLTRLPVETQKQLQLLACIGSSSKFALLEMVSHSSKEEMHGHLWDAVLAGLIFRTEDSYSFLHDRVQEAAYSLMPEELRHQTHLRVGRLLATHTSPENEDMIFEVVNQLNRAAGLIASREEREQLAELNLLAGKRAKASTAYASALGYFVAASTTLGDHFWGGRHELTFQLELHRAECEFLSGQPAAADQRLVALAPHADNTTDSATVTRLRMHVYTTLNQNDRAVAICLDYLRHYGIEWSAQPTNEEVQREYGRIWSQLGSREIEDLIALPLMTNPDVLEVLHVLNDVLTPALYGHETFSSLVICRIVNLSLEHGNSDGSCFGYEWFGIIAGPRFGNFDAGFRFGQLGYDLVEKRGLRRFQARTYYSFGDIVLPWTRHFRAGSNLIRRAFEAACEVGDLSTAAICRDHLMKNLQAAGGPLVDLQREAEIGLQFAQKIRDGRIVDHIRFQLGLIRSLRGLTSTLGSFNDDEFDELQFERYLASHPSMAETECWYWVRKMQARVLAGNYASAVDASLRADRLISTSPSRFMMLDPIETAEYHLYGALSRAAAWDSASPDQRQQHFDALVVHHRRLEQCAENCPENFENRALLVGAEIARIEGRDLSAMRLYEQAIGSAQANGFIHNAAHSSEIAGRFYSARGLEKVAHTYLRDARYNYLRWGADAKVRQLDELYPQLREEESPGGSTSTVGAPLQQLDLATVIKVSQAVSSEMVHEKLVDTLIRTALEHAGAERGLLILSREGEQRIEAEAVTNGETISVRRRGAVVDAVPESIVQYVARTRENVVIDDAAVLNPFSADPYIRQLHARSILSLPLIHQGKLIGILYLENNLAPRVFTPARIAVLKVLASQAAISLENTRLYRELAERESKIRRLVDANIIGIFIFALEGRIIEANDAFLHMVGYDREDLLAGRLDWTELTPIEWRDRDARQLVPEYQRNGILPPFEKEYIRKDGGRLPVLIGAASFEETGREGVAFVLDLSERKQAEESLRDSERRYHEAQMELAHANRIATLGQMSASIAHEINQPVAATVTNAQAALRFLDGPEPNIEEVRQALARIAKLGNRVFDVVERIRALVQKAPARKDDFEINEAIHEVISFGHGELVKHAVSVHSRFAEGLPFVRADRVQLQQVVLNLMMNAIEAMSSRPGGPRELRISTSYPVTAEILVAVEDSGPGLDAQNPERVFAPFYSTKPGGLGIGLAICRSIIEAHEGRLWAQPGKLGGAAFVFTLPAHRIDLGSDRERAAGAPVNSAPPGKGPWF